MSKQAAMRQVSIHVPRPPQLLQKTYPRVKAYGYIPTAGLVGGNHYTLDDTPRLRVGSHQPGTLYERGALRAEEVFSVKAVKQKRPPASPLKTKKASNAHECQRRVAPRTVKPVLTLVCSEVGLVSIRGMASLVSRPEVDLAD